MDIKIGIYNIYIPNYTQQLFGTLNASIFRSGANANVNARLALF
jgi:hypothetical protein